MATEEASVRDPTANGEHNKAEKAQTMMPPPPRTAAGGHGTSASTKVSQKSERGQNNAKEPSVQHQSNSGISITSTLSPLFGAQAATTGFVLLVLPVASIENKLDFLWLTSALIQVSRVRTDDTNTMKILKAQLQSSAATSHTVALDKLHWH